MQAANLDESMQENRRKLRDKTVKVKARLNDDLVQMSFMRSHWDPFDEYPPHPGKAGRGTEAGTDV